VHRRADPGEPPGAFALALLAIVQDLAGEAVVELAAEKSEDVLGAEVQRGVTQQEGIELPRAGRSANIRSVAYSA